MRELAALPDIKSKVFKKLLNLSQYPQGLPFCQIEYFLSAALRFGAPCLPEYCFDHGRIRIIDNTSK